MSIKDNLRDMMELRGISASELARRSGISRNEINELRWGEHPNPRLRIVKILAQELGCTAGWLLRK